MKYRNLGRSGLKISTISLGGWLTFGQSIDADRGKEIIRRAMDLGINFYDTANIYAAGKCEDMWGELLSGYRRSSFVLATKVFGKMGDWPTDEGLSRKHIMEQCDASLKRLKTSYIDLYQCHRYDDSTPLEETVRAMDDLIRQGKVHYWGFSEWSVGNIHDVMRVCEKSGYHRPISSQPQYNLLQRRIEPEIIPLCEREGVGQVVWSPLAQGLLTGKYKPGEEPPAGSRVSDPDLGKFIADKARNAELMEKVQRLKPVAEELGATIAQVALAWILRKENVSSAIVGASRPEQIEDNAKAAELELTSEQIERIEAPFAEK